LRKYNDKEGKKLIEELVETEGFDYGLIEYASSLEEIKDEEFHRLRDAYEESQTKLREYLASQGINLE
tara:strand:- start:85 stop:288 length:204 start_codon:yes stop_codon:yes gene_type:complete